MQPSFNGALASDPAASMPEAGGGQRQFLCVMNTIMALLGAAIAAFASSSAFDGKFNMVHIQNATLAGGVAIGSAANLSFSPAAAVAVGVVAGILSTAGFRWEGFLLSAVPFGFVLWLCPLALPFGLACYIL